MRGKLSPFLHSLCNRAGILAFSDATRMQLIRQNMVYVSRLRSL